MRACSPLLIRFLLVTMLAINLAADTARAADEGRSALESDPSGWVNILPSADLKGWYRVAVPPSAPLGRQHWHVNVQEKVLVCDGDGGHDMLLTEREYANAIFHFEFRYTKIEGGKGYNSGAYVRNNQDGSIWHQAQFGDAKDGFLFGQTLGTEGKKKSFRAPALSQRVKPAGEWNTVEITARGKTLTLWINGAKTAEFEGCGLEKGHLGVEAEGYRIEFRDLKVKELR